MDIQQIKLDYSWLPLLRRLDKVKKQSVKIVICSDNEPVIDIGLLQVKHQNAGQPGLKYHYVIKNNGAYDGTIYYCRPRIYQNGLPRQNNDDNDVISNSITVCLAGAYGTNATPEQVDSFVNLSVFLISQEALPLESIVFLSEFSGEEAQIANWNDMKTALNSRVREINSMKGLIEIPTVNGVVTSSEYGAIITNKDLNTLSEISTQTGIPESTLLQMNKHITFGTNITPDTIVYIPKGPALETIRISQQLGVAGIVMSQLDEKVNFAEAITRGSYGKTGEDLYSADKSFLTTEYGGKKGPTWLAEGLEFPGYHNAFIQITHSVTSDITTIPFLVSPSSSSEARSSSQQMTKTNAGWFVMRTGKNPVNLNISGYMLDAKNNLEKHEFLEKYKDFIEDTKNARMESTNPYSVKIRLEGRDYHGYIQSISFSKAAVQPFLYQYNMAFVILSDKLVYDAKQAALSVSKVNALIGTGQAQNVPDQIIATPGSTPAFSGISGVPTINSDDWRGVLDNISTALNPLDLSKNICSALYDMFEKSSIDMNDVTVISYEPTTGNPGHEM